MAKPVLICTSCYKFSVGQNPPYFCTRCGSDETVIPKTKAVLDQCIKSAKFREDMLGEPFPQHLKEVSIDWGKEAAKLAAELARNINDDHLSKLFRDRYITGIWGSSVKRPSNITGTLIIDDKIT